MATMSYSYGDGIAYLEVLTTEAHPMVHDLCAMHASTIRVPRGWELSDRWTDSGRPDGPLAEEQVQLDLIGA